MDPHEIPGMLSTFLGSGPGLGAMPPRPDLRRPPLDQPAIVTLCLGQLLPTRRAAAANTDSGAVRELPVVSQLRSFTPAEERTSRALESFSPVARTLAATVLAPPISED